MSFLGTVVGLLCDTDIPVRELADKSGIHHTTIYRWIRQSKGMQLLNNVERLVNVLGYTIEIKPMETGDGQDIRVQSDGREQVGHSS